MQSIEIALRDSTNHQKVAPTWGRWEITAFGLVAILTLANLITTFLQCGITPCAG